MSTAVVCDGCGFVTVVDLTIETLRRIKTGGPNQPGQYDWHRPNERRVGNPLPDWCKGKFILRVDNATTSNAALLLAWGLNGQAAIDLIVPPKKPRWRRPTNVDKHKSGRPPKDADLCIALLYDGRWIWDDGKPHLAFSYRNRRGAPIALYSECADHRNGGCVGFDCPARLAGSVTCDRFGCSNGKLFSDRYADDQYQQEGRRQT